MKKKIKVLLTILVLILTIFTSGCSKTIDVYALGSAVDMKGKNIPGYWINEVWVNLINSETLVKSGTYCIAATNNDVCVGGYIMTETSTWIPGYWHNGFWAKINLE